MEGKYTVTSSPAVPEAAGDPRPGPRIGSGLQAGPSIWVMA